MCDDLILDPDISSKEGNTVELSKLLQNLFLFLTGMAMFLEFDMRCIFTRKYGGL
jgi:hypothetical protein